MNHPRAIKSRHGFFALVPLLPISFATFGFTIITPIMIFTGDINFLSFVVGVIGCPYGIYMILKILTTRVTVTIDYLEFNHIWAKHKIKWKQVTKILVATNYFSRYNTHIYVQNEEKPITILTPYIGNYKRLGQAMIEAAKLANPDVIFAGWIKDAYGSPPYNIFPGEDAIR